MATHPTPYLAANFGLIASFTARYGAYILHATSGGSPVRPHHPAVLTSKPPHISDVFPTSPICLTIEISAHPRRLLHVSHLPHHRNLRTSPTPSPRLPFASPSKSPHIPDAFTTSPICLTIEISAHAHSPHQNLLTLLQSGIVTTPNPDSTPIYPPLKRITVNPRMTCERAAGGGVPNVSPISSGK